MNPCAAIILAGGQGQRLGMGPKALVKLEGVSLMERAHGRIQAAGIQHIVTVLPKGFSNSLGPCIENPDRKSGPLESAQLGLSLFTEQPKTLLLFPVDHVKVTTEQIKRLLEAATDVPVDCSRIIPTYQGRDGHPIVILEAGIRALLTPAPGTKTLREVLEAAGPALPVPALSPEIFFNLNTPKDWEDLHSQGQYSRQ